MKSLLLIAHGSPRNDANEQFINLCESIQKGTPDWKVSYAFLDCAEPDIPTAIDQLAQKGSTEIRILPYFLSEGKHTSEDIPKIIESKQKENPSLIINLMKPIGMLPEIVNLILNVIKTN